MEDLIFLNISNTCIINYLLHKIYNNDVFYKNLNLSENFYEKFKISPTYPVLKIFYDYIFTPLIPALHGLDKNISFMDIDINDPFFIMNCDWCSIFNGTIHTAIENIKKDNNLLSKIDFNKLKYGDKYLDFILVDRKVSNKVENNILLNMYLKSEMIELRWCPFKRSKDYYRNKDNRFLEPSQQMLFEVGKILSNHETITCNNCPKIINANWKRKSNATSAFKLLLDHMLRKIRHQ